MIKKKSVMKKRYVVLFAISLFGVLMIGLFPTKKRRLNSMWRALLNSQKGSCTFYVKNQEGEKLHLTEARRQKFHQMSLQPRLL